MDASSDSGDQSVGGCEDDGAVHLSPQGSGAADGSSAQNALAIGQISEAIELAGAGGLVCLEPGIYQDGVAVIRSGGTADAPVTVRALPGAIFRGDFVPVSDSDKKFGKDAIRVAASHVTLEGIECEAVGQCVGVPKEDGLVVEGLTIRGLRVERTGTGIMITRSGGQIMRDFKIEDAMILQFSRAGIALASTMERVTIERVYIDMQPDLLQDGRGSSHPVGIAFYNEVSDVLIDRATVLNVLGKSDGYSQGDGVDGERSVRDVTIRDSFFAGHRDGCVDTKAAGTVLERVTVAACKRNLRLWQNDDGDGPRCVSCSSYEPREGHLFTKGSTPARFGRFEVYSETQAKLVVYDGEGSVDIDELAGSLPSESNFTSAKNVEVEDNQIDYGAAFSTPAPPNHTSYPTP